MSQPDQNNGMQKAVVKAVLSGDTVIISPSNEILHLAHISCPRLTASQSGSEDAYAYAAREFLRSGLVGKEITYKRASAAVNTTGGPVSMYLSNGIDVALKVVENGWAKCRYDADENVRARPHQQAVRELTSWYHYLYRVLCPYEICKQFHEAESMAKDEQLGLWSEESVAPITVSAALNTPAEFLAKYKKQEIPAIVEQVRDGATVRLRLILDSENHQIINLNMCGVRAPRAPFRQFGQTQTNAQSVAPNDSKAEPFGEESRSFTEMRLLNRLVTVMLVGIPTSSTVTGLSNLTLADASHSQGSQAQIATFIGFVLHPAGKIEELLLKFGLARVNDWHATVVPEKMPNYRAIESDAKQSRSGIWQDHVPTQTVNQKTRLNGAITSSNFPAIVTRVWSADTISVIPDTDKLPSKERKFVLASLRPPRVSDQKLAGYAQEGKEFLRKRLIAKSVHVVLDYVKPAEGDYEEKTCVSLYMGADRTNVAIPLLEKGLVSVIRHRAGDERSHDFDQLLMAESKAVASKVGVHSAVDMPLPKVIDISENAGRAHQYLAQFKRQGKISVRVDHVASGSRFKLYIPREQIKLTLVLQGIKAPRISRPNEKGEAFGDESLEFGARRLQDHDAVITISSCDKSGGFIGQIFTPDGQDYAVELIRAGLATLHYSADSASNMDKLASAEESARYEKRGLWRNFEDVQEDDKTNLDLATDTASPNLFDLIVTDIRSEDSSFSFQTVSADSERFKTMMAEFALYHRTTMQCISTAKKGDLISAIFPADGQWYRAKVLRASQAKHEADVRFIDYGNQEHALSFTKMRDLPAKFQQMPGQARDAMLSFVQLLKGTDHDLESMARFRALCEGRNLIGSIDYQSTGSNHVRLIDPSDPTAASSSNASINLQLVSEGLALVDERLPYIKNFPDMHHALRQAHRDAVKQRLGAHQYGEIDIDV